MPGSVSAFQLPSQKRDPPPTVAIDGMVTRVVVDEESVDGEIVERSRNLVALYRETGGLHYFGEEMGESEDGVETRQPGAWRAGREGARRGVLVPGRPAVGAAYHEEFASGVAVDVTEIVSVNESFSTPAGGFSGVVLVRETTVLEPGVVEHKWHASGAGLVGDGELRLARRG